MKKYILLIALTLMCAPLYAQHNRCQKCNMEDLVPTLSAKQKRQLEAIDNEQRAQLSAVKKELKQVRDSVHIYISMYGDHTKTVHRLLERESELQLKMNKILYLTKVKIDKVITAEQHKEMRDNMAKNKERKKEERKKEDPRRPNSSNPPSKR